MNNNNKENKKPKNKSKKKKKSRKVFKTIALSIGFIILTGIIVACGYAYAIIKSAPELDVNSVLSLSEPSAIYDSNEQLIDTVHTEEERYVVSLNNMSDYLKNAYVSIEDERFYDHIGIDLRRIAGAAFTDVKNKLTGKSGLHGASTLTQQLLKNTILTNDVTMERKLTEMYLATKLEKILQKDQILEAYLNTIPLGGKLYGVEAASMYYFGKPAVQLNLIQSAYIAGITQAPSYYSAYTEKMQNDPTPFINRTKTVLSKMKDLGKISDEEYNQAISTLDEKKRDAYEFKTQKISYKLNYEWFVNPAISQVKKDLKEQLKLSDAEISKMLVNGGLKIYTTMDRSLQDHAQSVLDNEDTLSKFGRSSEKNDKGVYTLQASAVVMDYRTGQVKAMIGGRGEQDANSLNRAYSILKPIGSSTKPLTVYAPAIDLKMVNPATGFNDAPLPTEFQNKYKGNGEPYNPKNSPNQYSGIIPIRVALRESKNVVAVQVEDKIGLKNGIAYGEQFGLTYADASKNIAAVALGEFDSDPKNPDGGNPFILAQAYGTFGNSGIYTEGALYTKVVDATGKTILTKTPKTKTILSAQAAYITYDLLKEPVENYSSGKAKFGAMPVQGKTGTTSSSKDLWFAGLTPYLSGAVWVGYDKPEALGAGSGYVATLWGKIMEKAHEGLEVKDIPQPSGIHKMALSSLSGKLPSEGTARDPRGSKIVTDWVIDGSEPTETDDSYVIAKVNKLNGKLATASTPANLIEERVFIKGATGPDAKYAPPTELDDYKPSDDKKDDPKKDDDKKDDDAEQNDTPTTNNPTKPATH